MIDLIFPTDGLAISLLTPVQREFNIRQQRGEFDCEEFSDGPDYGGGVFSWIFDKYKQNFNWQHVTNPNEITLSAPHYIKFSWKADIPCNIEISRSADFLEVQQDDHSLFEVDYIYECDGVVTACLGNFLMNTEYFWRVVSKDGTQVSSVRSFRTLDEFPRCIYAQGTANVRDMGGARTYDGKRIRQGRLYRGGALESISERQYDLTPRGKRALTDVIGIRSEVDLRNEAVGVLSESVLGKSVNYKLFPVHAYSSFFSPECVNTIGRLIEFVADENNYPIYFHCLAGADRTGTLAYVIQMLLNVKAEYIIWDYNFTSLSLFDIRARTLDNIFTRAFVKEDELALDDRTKVGIAAKRIEEFLTDRCGVKPETIQRLKDNLLED